MLLNTTTTHKPAICSKLIPSVRLSLRLFHGLVSCNSRIEVYKKCKFHIEVSPAIAFWGQEHTVQDHEALQSSAPQARNAHILSNGKRNIKTKGTVAYCIGHRGRICAAESPCCNVSVLSMTEIDSTVKQEGWLPPTKRASAAKIN